MVDSELTDIIKVNLEEIDESEIIFNLSRALEHTSVLLELEDLEDVDLETIETILGLITKATEISDYFKTLIKSEEHKFTPMETLELRPIIALSDEFKKLIKSEESVLEERKEILRTILGLRRHLLDSKIGMLMMNNEERGLRVKKAKKVKKNPNKQSEVGVEIEDYKEREENRCEKREEMRVGDIMISKSPIKRVGVEKYHEVFEIDGQHGDMFFVTKLKCIKKHPRHGTPKDGHKGHVKYDVKFNKNGYSCREHKDVLYENYEKFDKDKTYKLWLRILIARNISILGYNSDKRLSRDFKVT